MYSQTGELEGILDTVFKHNPVGFFLEIGCWDGYNLSQTAYLELDYGWKGLCVDPFPRNFQNRKCTLCNYAISSDGLDRDFVWVRTDKRNGGDVSYLSGFKDTITEHWDFIREHCDYTETYIDTITMEHLYRKYKLPHYIDFLSIDTEGAELEILASINVDYFRFGMISVEHNNNENVRRHINRLLTRRGYRFYKQMGINGIEDVFLNEGLSL